MWYEGGEDARRGKEKARRGVKEWWKRRNDKIRRGGAWKMRSRLHLGFCSYLMAEEVEDDDEDVDEEAESSMLSLPTRVLDDTNYGGFLDTLFMSILTSTASV